MGENHKPLSSFIELSKLLEDRKASPKPSVPVAPSRGNDDKMAEPSPPDAISPPPHAGAISQANVNLVEIAELHRLAADLSILDAVDENLPTDDEFADREDRLDALSAALCQVREEIVNFRQQLATREEAAKEVFGELELVRSELAVAERRRLRSDRALANEQERTLGAEGRLSDAKKKLYALRRERKELTAQLVSSERAVRNLRSVNSRLAAEVAIAKAMGGIVPWIMKAGVGRRTDLFPKTLATIGSGSFRDTELDEYLQSAGFNLVWPGSGRLGQTVEVMVVGREGWDEGSLEAQLAAREGKVLRVYSQELFFVSLASGKDLLDKLDTEELLEIARGHPALSFLVESDLQWPLTVVEALADDFRPFDTVGHADESPLKKLGYTVGITNGMPTASRRALLSKAVLGDIPWVQSKEYMTDWGKPNTRRRLWRIAHHLSWLARTWQRIPNHAYAVGDWVDDLKYLQKAHYRPWMRFKWPKVKVPGA